MNKIFALFLIIVGGGLVWHGFQIRDSLKGRVQDISSDVHRSWNGDAKLTDATWFMIGGVLVVAGATAALKK